jgi:hypothetical protein
MRKIGKLGVVVRVRSKKDTFEVSRFMEGIMSHKQALYMLMEAIKSLGEIAGILEGQLKGKNKEAK